MVQFNFGICSGLFPWLILILSNFSLILDIVNFKTVNCRFCYITLKNTVTVLLTLKLPNLSCVLQAIAKSDKESYF